MPPAIVKLHMECPISFIEISRLLFWARVPHVMVQMYLSESHWLVMKSGAIQPNGLRSKPAGSHVGGLSFLQSSTRMPQLERYRPYRRAPTTGCNTRRAATGVGLEVTRIALLQAVSHPSLGMWGNRSSYSKANRSRQDVSNGLAW